MRPVPRDRRHKQAASSAVAPDAIFTTRIHAAARPPYGPGSRRKIHLPEAKNQQVSTMRSSRTRDHGPRQV